NATSEKDQPASNTILHFPLLARRREEAGVERVGLAQTPKGMARLCKRVEPSGGQRQGIKTECVGGISFGLRDRLAAGPDLRRVSRRGSERANLAITVDYSRPHPRAMKESSSFSAFLL